MLQDTLTNQLLTFPPWQEMLWGEVGVRALCLPYRAVEVASCSDLTVLFEQDNGPIVNLKLAMVLQTSHLEGDITSSPGDHWKKWDGGFKCVKAPRTEWRRVLTSM